VAEVLADPIAKNSALGEFTHFGNVLDLTGISVPAGTYPVKDLADEARVEEGKGATNEEAVAEAGDGGGDGSGSQLPFGVTLIGGSRSDADILEIARRFEEAMKVKGEECAS
jgi:Asp-tRNA(Asn)/Glu-tRNA(Gln) amidotransferase A subunit family amidase